MSIKCHGTCLLFITTWWMPTAPIANLATLGPETCVNCHYMKTVSAAESSVGKCQRKPLGSIHSMCQRSKLKCCRVCCKCLTWCFRRSLGLPWVGQGLHTLQLSCKSAHCHNQLHLTHTYKCQTHISTYAEPLSAKCNCDLCSALLKALKLPLLSQGVLTGTAVHILLVQI